MITFCIAAYNAASTIKMVLTRLMDQEILRPDVLVSVTDGKDGTLELLNAIKRNNWFPGMQLNIFSSPIGTGTFVERIAAIRKELVAKVKTPFLMFVDSDILLWPKTVQPVLTEMLNDRSTGMLGIKSNGNNHVGMAAAMLRTEIAQQLDWNVRKSCECSWVAKQLRRRSLTVKHAAVEQARHILFDKVQ